MSIIPPNPRLERHLRLARMIMSWERVWPRLIPTLTILMLIAGLTLTGTFEMLPATGHIILLSILSVAGLVAIILPWRHFTWPNRRAVLQRMEQENGLENNPLQSLEDHIEDSDDPLTSYLWQKQLQRHEAMLNHLHLPRPVPSLARVDRYGLVILPVLLLSVGLFAGHDRMSERFYKAFSPLQRLGTADFSTTLWVTPPAYTGQIPRVLRFEQVKGAQKQDDGGSDASRVIDVDVPVGSTLAGSIGSVWQPTLHTPTGERDISESSDNSYVLSTALDQAGPWRISVWGTDRLTLNVNLVADKPPALSFVSPPSITRREHIRLDYVATDDYGMKNLELVITPATDGIGREQFGTIDNIRIDLSGGDTPGGEAAMPTRIEGPRFIDLVSHPWAGLPVNLQLVSKDNAGQDGESDIRSIILPEREFTHPVAKKLITIRRGLLRYPDKALEMRNALLPVIYAPQAFNGHIGIFLALSVTEARLSAHLRDRAVHQDVAGLLWHIAEEIERGSYGMAERNLMEAEERLLDALANPDVTEAEIADLIENYRRALNEYMAALAREAPQNQQSQQQGPAAILEQQDLSRIVDQIEALMQAGARDQARALIDRLRELVENMQITSGDGGADITSTLREMLDGIRDLARRQQDLMNQGDNPSSPGGNGNRAQQQQNLAGDAQNLTNNSGFGQFGNLSGIETAIEAMQRAAEALDHNRAHEALQQQGQAMEALQQGIGELSRALEGLSQMMPMLDELQGSGNRDPLGRPVGGDGTTVIPEVDTLERAWRILQELRRRSGDPDRPVIEQEYIDRLLKRF
ncbi:DUF4175 domain-containing protein [Thalassospira sp. MCCC 1A03138]|uniref:DUF4175 domain-containing protein n=1 Tax=Thalassospira sp. MCCC 1A03138 TaxID=1470576 RepID=UPI000A2262F0|nr:DUF4175 family protein [Thalassospira sp. MCCC 1A03138]OSQ29489.1 hypothetical protein TH468_15280 [Thalassospira sp. MCCC 1A03138]